MEDNANTTSRKRQAGGGRKPNPKKLITVQFSLEPWQARALKDAAESEYMSQSEWLRRLLSERLYG